MPGTATIKMSSERPGPAVWIATAGGAGFFPVAPGTAGSVVGVAAILAIRQMPLPRATAIGLIAAVVLAILFLGVWSAGEAEKFFGRTDPGQVVIDEVVGQMLTLMLVPQATWKWLLGGFVLFRVLDIIKPIPARQAERIPRGWGIMLDDVIAGLYGMATLTVIGFFYR